MLSGGVVCGAVDVIAVLLHRCGCCGGAPPSVRRRWLLLSAAAAAARGMRSCGDVASLLAKAACRYPESGGLLRYHACAHTRASRDLPKVPIVSSTQASDRLGGAGILIGIEGRKGVSLGISRVTWFSSRLRGTRPRRARTAYTCTPISGPGGRLRSRSGIPHLHAHPPLRLPSLSA